MRDAREWAESITPSLIVETVLHEPFDGGDDSVDSAVVIDRDALWKIISAAQHEAQQFFIDEIRRANERRAASDQALIVIAQLVLSYIEGDEPEGAPSARRTVLGIADVLDEQVPGWRENVAGAG